MVGSQQSVSGIFLFNFPAAKLNSVCIFVAGQWIKVNYLANEDGNLDVVDLEHTPLVAFTFNFVEPPKKKKKVSFRIGTLMSTLGNDISSGGG
jgi:hypothetical protein